MSRGDLLVSVTEQGTVESSNNVEIKCNVKGGSTVLWVIETGTIVQPGDLLIRLDQSQIEDNILQQQIAYETVLAEKITAESDVAAAEIAITEYLEGTYEGERNTIENEIFVAEQDLKRALLSYESVKRLVARGLLTNLQLEGEQFAVDSARKTLESAQKRLVALEKYTKEKMLQELRSALRAAQARLASFEASLELERARLERAKTQLENCTIRADTTGMVIFPSMEAWKEVPDIEEGATVREQQTLLMIPDVDQMQVKVGIHESKVDRLGKGMPAQVQLQDQILEGEVASVASVARPTGWWTNNMVTYDTIIKLYGTLPSLKPGMTCAAEIILADYQNVLSVPVAAVLEQGNQFSCFVQTEKGIVYRSLMLGDSNDRFVIVEDGLEEGEQIVLNPLDFLDEAQKNEMKSLGHSEQATATELSDTVPSKEGSKEKPVAPAKNKVLGTGPGNPAAPDKLKP